MGGQTPVIIMVWTLSRGTVIIKPKIDENRPLPYKPRQLSSMARFNRAGSFWSPDCSLLNRIWPSSRHFRTNLINSAHRQNLAFKTWLYCLRRTTREADLSTQQAGAQAPSRLSRSPRHHWRSQGSRCAPRTWPQASERLNKPDPEHHPMRRLRSWTG
jgi:hypothetical protein